ncbi:MAG: glycosyltransferase family 2 protein [Bdellovibrionales bacterium]|nr:glycosyltransferase family 2 protein [Bdellovibrionales bacterium]
MKFTIVVPVYQNEANLDTSIPELLSLAPSLEGELELVFVDDGSKDSSFDILLNYQRQYPGVIKLVQFTKNFGQTSAIRAGIRESTGDCVGIISADLQDPPTLFLEMIRIWKEGHSVVIAERTEREERFFHRFVSQTYWKAVSRFALTNYPEGGFDFCLFDKQVASDVNRFREGNTNIFAIVFWLGYDFQTIPYRRRLRREGKSQWTLAKKLRLLADTFIGFSFLPIRFISYMGVLVSVSALFFTVGAVFSYFFLGTRYPGWTSIATLTAGIGGLVLLTLGVIGEYLWRILDEVRGRPFFVVKRKLID